MPIIKDNPTYCFCGRELKFPETKGKADFKCSCGETWQIYNEEVRVMHMKKSGKLVRM